MSLLQNWQRLCETGSKPMAERVDRTIHRDQGVNEARLRAYGLRQDMALLLKIEEELARQQKRVSDGFPIDREKAGKILTAFHDMS